MKKIMDGNEACSYPPDSKAVQCGKEPDTQKGCRRDHYCHGRRTGRRAGGKMDS